MNKTALSLAIGAAMTTSVALAEGPVPLTDAQLDNVTAGGDGSLSFFIEIQKLKLVAIQKLVDVEQRVDFSVVGSGFIAEAEAGANCSFPTDCKADTLSAVDINVDRFFAGDGLPEVTAISESFAAAPSLLSINGGP